VTFLTSGGPGLPSKKKSKPLRKPIKIQWDASATVAANASAMLPALARSFFEAGGALAAGKPPLQAIHRFRLLTKRFRYDLELFRPCYGPGLERRIEALQNLQQRLGEVSDCAATQRLLRGRTDLPRAHRERLIRHLSAITDTRVYHFVRHWQTEFAPGRERWWTSYLTRFAGPRKRRKPLLRR
jgi:CHAD domain-containing protein